MNETELWIRQAKEYLRTARRSGRRRPAEGLLERVGRLDLERAQADLGCGEHCAECSWGQLGGHPLRDTCRLVTLQKALEDLEAESGRAAPAAPLLRRLMARFRLSGTPRSGAGPAPSMDGLAATGPRPSRGQEATLLELLESLPTSERHGFPSPQV